MWASCWEVVILGQLRTAINFGRQILLWTEDNWNPFRTLGHWHLQMMGATSVTCIYPYTLCSHRIMTVMCATGWIEFLCARPRPNVARNILSTNSSASYLMGILISVADNRNSIRFWNIFRSHSCRCCCLPILQLLVDKLVYSYLILAEVHDTERNRKYLVI
jgi:hypothetical protein